MFKKLIFTMLLAMPLTALAADLPPIGVFYDNSDTSRCIFKAMHETDGRVPKGSTEECLAKQEKQMIESLKAVPDNAQNKTYRELARKVFASWLTVKRYVVTPAKYELLHHPAVKAHDSVRDELRAELMLNGVGQ